MTSPLTYNSNIIIIITITNTSYTVYLPARLAAETYTTTAQKFVFIYRLSTQLPVSINCIH